MGMEDVSLWAFPTGVVTLLHYMFLFRYFVQLKKQGDDE